MAMIIIVFGLLLMLKERLMKGILKAGSISKWEVSQGRRLCSQYTEFTFYGPW